MFDSKDTMVAFLTQSSPSREGVVADDNDEDVYDYSDPVAWTQAIDEENVNAEDVPEVPAENVTEIASDSLTRSPSKRIVSNDREYSASSINVYPEDINGTSTSLYPDDPDGSNVVESAEASVVSESQSFIQSIVSAFSTDTYGISVVGENDTSVSGSDNSDISEHSGYLPSTLTSEISPAVRIKSPPRLKKKSKRAKEKNANAHTDDEKKKDYIASDKETKTPSFCGRAFQDKIFRRLIHAALFFMLIFAILATVATIKSRSNKRNKKKMDSNQSHSKPVNLPPAMFKPVAAPSAAPSKLGPTVSPSVNPTSKPSISPAPTISPTTQAPYTVPTMSPITSEPTRGPTLNPTNVPKTSNPTFSPTRQPTFAPTKKRMTSSPTFKPTPRPTVPPTLPPTPNPTKSPTVQPKPLPTRKPTTPEPTTSPTIRFIDIQNLIYTSSPQSIFALSDPTSPQFKAFQWLVQESANYKLGNDEKLVHRWVLAVLFESTGGRQTWKNSANWLTSADECEWFTAETQEAICNDEGMIRVLNLENNGLTGTLPQELGLLNELTLISLHGNQLDGDMPSDVCELFNQDLQELSVDCDLVTCTCGCLCK